MPLISRQFPEPPKRKAESNLPPGNGPQSAVARCPRCVPSLSQSWPAQDKAVPMPECLCMAPQDHRLLSQHKPSLHDSPAHPGPRHALGVPGSCWGSEAQSRAAQTPSTVAEGSCVMCHSWDTGWLCRNQLSAPGTCFSLGLRLRVLPVHTDVVSRWRAALLSPGSHLAEATTP